MMIPATIAGVIAGSNEAMELPFAQVNPDLQFDTPVIAGVVATCIPGEWFHGGTNFTYQWQRSPDYGGMEGPTWSNLAGQTGNTYTVQSGDDLYRFQCLVTAYNDAGASEPTPTPELAPEL